MIEIKGLTVRYRQRHRCFLALDNINLTINNGDICAVIGPSGCGKSTFLYVLSGIIKEYEGNVLIDGKHINASEQRIGLILQDYGLLPWRNVYDNVTLGLKMKGGYKGDTEYIQYIVERLGLRDLLDRYPGQLSGGQRQRVAIARSFVLRPSILLMDEPFSALDAITREEMQDLFLKIWNEYRVSTVLVTHSIDEAIYLGRKIAILSPSPGRIIKIIENPLFGTEDLRIKNEFYEMEMEIRKIIRGDSHNES
ncbi:ABC transporter ATP-binding protein [Calorimonas adulescens]|uniref:ABC transporter ATP-binding protein n=1 Tax=Calorimonas adulescens TaxID=2606906 RepID=A0A5D8QGH6_9THEO|nr:ABC transporter ATP-binding protein [Calorimonas adulescens]TZE83601.1 ABC transporter ATP-binding protein [Calorimonas adulescens]